MKPKGLNRARFRRGRRLRPRGTINRAWLGEFVQIALLERLILGEAADLSLVAMAFSEFSTAKEPARLIAADAERESA